MKRFFRARAEGGISPAEVTKPVVFQERAEQRYRAVAQGRAA